MDLGQLRYFIKIVEHGSFTRAAQDCSVSQPALSQQIAKLEKELGQPLFERQGRTIQITSAGKLLKSHADKILQLVDDAKRQITDDGQTGRVSIGAIPTIGPYLLPQILRCCSDQFHAANFVVSELVTKDLLKRCANGEINAGLVALPFDAKNLNIEPMFEEELLLALPAQHRLCNAKEISIEDLADESFISLNEMHCLVDHIDSFCERQGFQPLTTTRIQQLETVQNLVARGHGISFVPAMARRALIESGICYRSMNGPKPFRTIAVCSNPLRYQSQLLQNVLKAVHELLSDPSLLTKSHFTENTNSPIVAR